MIILSLKKSTLSNLNLIPFSKELLLMNAEHFSSCENSDNGSMESEITNDMHAN